MRVNPLSQNQIKKVTANMALEASLNGERVVVEYKPQDCQPFVNQSVFGPAINFNYDEFGELSSVDLDVSGITIERTEILDFYVIVPTSDQLENRKRLYSLLQSNSPQ